MKQNFDLIKSVRKIDSPLLMVTAAFALIMGIYVSVRAFAAAAPEPIKPTTRMVSKISISESKQSTPFGQLVAFQASVPSECGGSVNFYDGTIAKANLIGVAPVKSGKASMTTVSLSPGSHQVVAGYRGSTACKPAVSTPITETVDKLNGGSKVTAISLASSRNNVVIKTPITLIANVSGDCGPTGNIKFYDGTVDQSALIGATPYHNGRAVLVHTFAPGAHKVIASYEGDSSCDKSTSAPLTQTVAQ